MEIRDVLHGSIQIEPYERSILDSRYFQRLRQIKQLGFAEHSYPSATHNRYIHSLGAMNVATQAFETLFGANVTRSLSGPQSRPTQQANDRLRLLDHSPQAFYRLRAVVRLAALLHDVGHGPLSHTTEFAMPPVGELRLPDFEGDPSRRADHEDYTLKILLDSELTRELEKAGAPFGFTPKHVAALIDPRLRVSEEFFIEKIDGVNVNFRPLLQQLISSEMDADRMDYLRRDSFFAGVSYGEFDFDWLVSNLTSHVKDGKCYLALQHRALYSFEDFLISRFHMFLMVYFHYKSEVYDEMLSQYFKTAPGEYQIPADIEKYIDYVDAHLYQHLARSSNPWAKRITEKNSYRMLLELHSGIPPAKVAREHQEKLYAQVKAQLAEKKIHFIEGTSTGELSKYFRKEADPIFVRYDNLFSQPAYIPLEKCTDLFERYQEKRSITRLYVASEDLTAARALGGGFGPLPF